MIHDAWPCNGRYALPRQVIHHPLLTMAATAVATTIVPSDPAAASKYYFSLYSQRPDDDDSIPPVLPLQQLIMTTTTSMRAESKLFFSTHSILTMTTMTTVVTVTSIDDEDGNGHSLCRHQQPFSALSRRCPPPALALGHHLQHPSGHDSNQPSNPSPSVMMDFQ